MNRPLQRVVVTGMALASFLACSASDADAQWFGRRNRCCSYSYNTGCCNNYGYNYGYYGQGHNHCCGYNQVGYGGHATGCGCGYGYGQSGQVIQYQTVQRGDQARPGNQAVSQQQRPPQPPSTIQESEQDYPTYQTRVAPVNVPVDSANGTDESNENDNNNDENDNSRTQDNDDEET